MTVEELVAILALTARPVLSDKSLAISTPPEMISCVSPDGTKDMSIGLSAVPNAGLIGAHVDAARIAANVAVNGLLGGSTQLAEALVEDMDVETTTNDLWRISFWMAVFQNLDWQFVQARRGALSDFNADRVWASFGHYFETWRSFEAFWNSQKTIFSPEFVEWVEEQRANAA